MRGPLRDRHPQLSARRAGRDRRRRNPGDPPGGPQDRIQVEFELEDAELAAEALPSYDDRRRLLFYEAAEGGAGVLRRLAHPQEHGALTRVAQRALEICHFDADGRDLGQAPGSDEPCAAACYDCLMSYSNQWDHGLLDRFRVRELLVAWTPGILDASPVEIPRNGHLEELLRLTDSDLERRWLRFVDAHGLKLPSEAQVLIADAGARVDFLYRREGAAVFVDGPHHDDPRQRETDRRQENDLEDLTKSSKRSTGSPSSTFQGCSGWSAPSGKRDRRDSRSELPTRLAGSPGRRNPPGSELWDDLDAG